MAADLQRVFAQLRERLRPADFRARYQGAPPPSEPEAVEVEVGGLRVAASLSDNGTRPFEFDWPPERGAHCGCEQHRLAFYLAGPMWVGAGEPAAFRLRLEFGRPTHRFQQYLDVETVRHAYDGTLRLFAETAGRLLAEAWRVIPERCRSARVWPLFAYGLGQALGGPTAGAVLLGHFQARAEPTFLIPALLEEQPRFTPEELLRTLAAFLEQDAREAYAQRTRQLNAELDAVNDADYARWAWTEQMRRAQYGTGAVFYPGQMDPPRAYVYRPGVDEPYYLGDALNRPRQPAITSEAEQRAKSLFEGLFPSLAGQTEFEVASQACPNLVYSVAVNRPQIHVCRRLPVSDRLRPVGYLCLVYAEDQRLPAYDRTAQHLLTLRGPERQVWERGIWWPNGPDSPVFDRDSPAFESFMRRLHTWAIQAPGGLS